jgi:bloom syndrome protein
MALTATATGKVQEDVQKLLGLVNPQKSVMSFNRPNIRYEVRYKALLGDEYNDLKTFIMSQPNPTKCCGVICTTKSFHTLTF